LPGCCTGAAQAADPNLARNLAATCANCHGTNGNAVKGSGMMRWPAWKRPRSLQKLADFKSGDKPASIMHQISQGLYRSATRPDRHLLRRTEIRGDQHDADEKT
jgi:cytochrome c553